jgi:YspA, cpYpsA-related SLOG family
MKILVCGGRAYADAPALYNALDAIHREKHVARLIHGAARGADSLAACWASSRGIPLQAFPADWETHGRAAGYIRNEQMLLEGHPDLVVAFPGGKGTSHMVSVSEAVGIPVLMVGSPDGGRP